MIRTLLTTTAITILMSAGVMAQDAAPAAPAETMAPAAPATDSMAPAAPAADAMTPAAPATDPAATTTPVDTGAAQTVDVKAPWDLSAGYTAADTDNLGTRLIGQPVYSSTGDDAEEIGKISDIVFDAEGQITAVVIGVGGFLGIGEKAVAVDFHSLEFTLAADNTERWVVPTTADALTAAPEFVWKEDKPVEGAAETGVVAPATN